MKPVNKAKRGHNKFCGPAALSILTGCDTQQAAAILRKVTGERAIKGVWSTHIRKALTILGYTTTRLPIYQFRGSVLGRWVKSSREYRGGDVFLLNAGHHWCVVHKGQYCCGLTGVPVSVSQIPTPNARVMSIYRVDGRDPVPAEEILRPDVSRSRKVGEARRKAVSLAKTYDISIDVDYYTGSTFWVYPPENLNADDDPFYDLHYVDDWFEVLERCRVYAALLSKEK